jgi:ABC-type Fe3+-citrate transport system substrate-binding protein
MRFVNFKKKLMKMMFRNEIKDYEETIDLLNECLAGMIVKESELANEIEELAEFINMYEQELNEKERELKMMDLIVGSLKLYENK